jgi:hypothetical protein
MEKALRAVPGIWLPLSHGNPVLQYSPVEPKSRAVSNHEMKVGIRFRKRTRVDFCLETTVFCL